MSAPSLVEQIFRRGIEISRHHFKGVYVCTIGKSRHDSSSEPAQVICTLYEGDNIDEVGEYEQSDLNTKYGPLTFLYEGHRATLRPWNPRECVIAAGIRNLLVHFPIRPGSRIFALDCSLMTLSHIADTIGSTGHLVGIIDPDSPERPSQEELSRFLRRHSCAQVILEDVKNSSLERYEQLLSCSEACRFAFLMAFHPRLGFNSPARVLALSDSARKITGRIFSFLQCNGIARTKCLVSCHCPPDSHADAIREVVLTHIDIIHQWRTADFGEFGDPAAKHVDMGGDDSGGPDDDDAPADSTAQADSASTKMDRPKAKKQSKSEPENGPRWVLMGLATDHIVVDSAKLENNTSKLSAIVDNMKRLKSGLRTGLLAKEQLLLTPYFSNHFLLLLRYAARRDERGQRAAKKMPLPPGLDIEIEDTAAASSMPADEFQAPASSGPAPASAALPMPSFLAPASNRAAASTASPENLALALPPGLTRAEPGPSQILAGQAPAAPGPYNMSSHGQQAPAIHAAPPEPFDTDMLRARGRAEANMMHQMLRKRGLDAAPHMPGMLGAAAPAFGAGYPGGKGAQDTLGSRGRNVFVDWGNGALALGMGGQDALAPPDFNSGPWGSPGLPDSPRQDAPSRSLSDLIPGIWGATGLPDRGNDPVYQNLALPPPNPGLWGGEGGGNSSQPSVGRGNTGASGGFDAEAQLAMNAGGQRWPATSQMHPFAQQWKGAGRANFPPVGRHSGGPPGRFQ